MFSIFKKSAAARNAKNVARREMFKCDQNMDRFEMSCSCGKH